MAGRKEIAIDGEKTRFTSERQPVSNGRKPGARAWRDVLASMMPEEGYLTFDKAQEVDEAGQPTGRIIPKVRVKMATQEMIVMAAIKQAMKGKVEAIKMLMDRMDGRPTVTIAGDPDAPLEVNIPLIEWIKNDKNGESPNK